MARIGINAKVYRNTTSYEGPTWSEVALISDLSVSPAWEEADASARESRVKQTVKTMLGLEFSGKLKKKPLDANYEAIMNAFTADDILDLLILDGDLGTEGNRGWRCDCQVFSASEDQGLGTALYEDITLKPSATEHGARAVRVGSGGTLQYAVPGKDGATFS